MIPYDDLVYALTQWRARKGLPVASVAASVAPAVAPSARAVPAAPAPGYAPPAARPAPPAPAAGQLAYPGAPATQAAFGAPPAPAATQHGYGAPTSPNFAAVQAAFSGGAAYEHEVSEVEEVIHLGDDQPSPGDAMSFEMTRPGTQPGIAPSQPTGKPGARR